MMGLRHLSACDHGLILDHVITDEAACIGSARKETTEARARGAYALRWSRGFVQGLNVHGDSDSVPWHFDNPSPVAVRNAHRARKRSRGGCHLPRRQIIARMRFRTIRTLRARVPDARGLVDPDDDA